MHIFHKWVEKDRQAGYRFLECAICGKRKVIREEIGGHVPMKYPDWETNGNQKLGYRDNSNLEKFKPRKYSREKIEEARKRLDMSSRGSEEEYCDNFLEEYKKIAIPKICEVITRDLVCDSLDKKVNSIVIDGVVDVRENPITVNDFLDKFIEWVESNHWYFGGTTREYIEDEEDG